MSDNIIAVEHLSKMYKLYDKPMDRLKESLGLSRKRNIKSTMLYRMFPSGQQRGNGRDYRN